MKIKRKCNENNLHRGQIFQCILECLTTFASNSQTATFTTKLKKTLLTGSLLSLVLVDVVLGTQYGFLTFFIIFIFHNTMFFTSLNLLGHRLSQDAVNCFMKAESEHNISDKESLCIWKIHFKIINIGQKILKNFEEIRIFQIFLKCVVVNFLNTIHLDFESILVSFIILLNMVEVTPNLNLQGIVVFSIPIFTTLIVNTAYNVYFIRKNALSKYYTLNNSRNIVHKKLISSLDKKEKVVSYQLEEGKPIIHNETIDQGTLYHLETLKVHDANQNEEGEFLWDFGKSEKLFCSENMTENKKKEEIIFLDEAEESDSLQSMSQNDNMLEKGSSRKTINEEKYPDVLNAAELQHCFNLRESLGNIKNNVQEEFNKTRIETRYTNANGEFPYHSKSLGLSALHEDVSRVVVVQNVTNRTQISMPKRTSDNDGKELQCCDPQLRLDLTIKDINIFFKNKYCLEFHRKEDLCLMQPLFEERLHSHLGIKSFQVKIPKHNMKRRTQVKTDKTKILKVKFADRKGADVFYPYKFAVPLTDCRDVIEVGLHEEMKDENLFLTAYEDQKDLCNSEGEERFMQFKNVLQRQPNEKKLDKLPVFDIKEKILTDSVNGNLLKSCNDHYKIKSESDGKIINEAKCSDLKENVCCHKLDIRQLLQYVKNFIELGRDGKQICPSQSVGEGEVMDHFENGVLFTHHKYVGHLVSNIKTDDKAEFADLKEVYNKTEFEENECTDTEQRVPNYSEIVVPFRNHTDINRITLDRHKTQFPFLKEKDEHYYNSDQKGSLQHVENCLQVGSDKTNIDGMLLTAKNGKSVNPHEYFSQLESDNKFISNPQFYDEENKCLQKFDRKKFVHQVDLLCKELLNCHTDAKSDQTTVNEGQYADIMQQGNIPCSKNGEHDRNVSSGLSEPETMNTVEFLGPKDEYWQNYNVEKPLPYIKSRDQAKTNKTKIVKDEFASINREFSYPCKSEEQVNHHKNVGGDVLHKKTFNECFYNSEGEELSKYLENGFPERTNKPNIDKLRFNDTEKKKFLDQIRSNRRIMEKENFHDLKKKCESDYKNDTEYLLHQTELLCKELLQLWINPIKSENQREIDKTEIDKAEFADSKEGKYSSKTRVPFVHCESVNEMGLYQEMLNKTQSLTSMKEDECFSNSKIEESSQDIENVLRMQSNKALKLPFSKNERKIPADYPENEKSMTNLKDLGQKGFAKNLIDKVPISYLKGETEYCYECDEDKLLQQTQNVIEVGSDRAQIYDAQSVDKREEGFHSENGVHLTCPKCMHQRGLGLKEIYKTPSGPCRYGEISCISDEEPLITNKDVSQMDAAQKAADKTKVQCQLSYKNEEYKSKKTYQIGTVKTVNKMLNSKKGYLKLNTGHFIFENEIASNNKICIEYSESYNSDCDGKVRKFRYWV